MPKILENNSPYKNGNANDHAVIIKEAIFVITLPFTNNDYIIQEAPDYLYFSILLLYFSSQNLEYSSLNLLQGVSLSM